MSCAEARAEVLLADAGRAMSVVITEGVLAGRGVIAAVAGLKGGRGVGAEREAFCLLII